MQKISVLVNDRLKQ